MSMKSFIPPKLNYPILWFTDLSLPLLLKLVHNIDEVVISPEDRKTIHDLRNERLIYLSNHPSTQEPPIAYSIANLMNSRFHYMASREVFDWGMGFVGDFIQSIGAFSVIAGTSDRESLKTTRGILSNPKGKLVLFPEGEPTSGLNDTLLPFQPGIAQLGFWGLEDALKKEQDAKLYILPAFIKYRMNGSRSSQQREIDTSLQRLETHFGLSKAGKDVVHRFLSIGKKMIEKSEKEFGIVPEKPEDFDYRIGKLRHSILNNVAEKTNIKKWNPDDNAIEKLRKILSVLELVVIGAPDPKGELPSPETARWARAACQQAYDFIAIQTTYIKEYPSSERLFEWLYRFESETFGESKQRPHNAEVKLIPPFLLNDYYEAYKADKKKTVDQITQDLRHQMEKVMEKESQRSPLLFEPGTVF